MTTTKALSIMLALCCATPALSQQQHQIRLEWSKNLTEYRGQNGRRLTHVCPPRGQLLPVYGTDTYTDDSGACSAAVHAGLITLADGGVVTIVIDSGRSSYPGSTRNGVTSQSFRSWWGSFSFDRSATEGRVDWSTSAEGLELAGRPLTVVCPPGGKSTTVWGTDTYTESSSICVAAVHAGLITLDAGGRVTVEDAGAQKSYAASERNGVQSREYGGTPNGFRVARGGGASSLEQVGSTAPTAVTSMPVASTPVKTATPTATTATTAQIGTTVTARPGVNTTTATRAPVELAATSRADATAGVTTTPSSQVGRLGAGAVSPDDLGATALPSDPPAVHATDFKAYALYGTNAFTWRPAPGAVGYRLARATWDPVKLAFVAGSDVEIPAAKVADSAGLIRDTAFVDRDVKAGTQYVYWLGTYFRSASGDFYFPTSGQYPSVTVNPRDPAGMTWLPSDWKTPPTMLSASIIGDTAISLVWQRKVAARGYEMWAMRQSRGAPAFSSYYPNNEIDDCGGHYGNFAINWLKGGQPYMGGLNPSTNVYSGFPFLPEPSVVKNISKSDPVPGSMTSYSNDVYCLVIKAVYPDLSVDGTPTLVHGVYSDPVVARARFNPNTRKWELSPLREGLTFYMPSWTYNPDAASPDGQCRVGKAQANTTPCIRSP